MRRLYDVTLFLPPDGRETWRTDYESAWDALADACARAQARSLEVIGVRAMRVPDPVRDGPMVAPARWQCSCGNVGIPAHLASCDRCGRRQP